MMMGEARLDKRPVVFVSQDDLTFNGRFIKVRDALEALDIQTGAVLLSEPIRPHGGTFQVIARPELAGGRLASSLSYRIQKRHAIQTIISFAPRVLHAMDYIALDIAAAVKKKIPVDIVFDACEFFSDTASANPAVAQYVDKIFKRHSSQLNTVIAPSRHLQSYYTARYPAWPKLKLVTNAPASVFTGQYDGRLHEASGLNRSHKILLYHGGFSPKRGLEALVETAAELPENYYLVLMGWGILQAILETNASAVNKQAKRKVVRFVPPVPQTDLFNWISGAEFGLIPYEGGPLNHNLCTPNKLYEYPATGVPLIATDRPSLVEIINQAGIGVILSSPLTGEKIKTHVESLKTQDRQAMAEASIRFARAEVGGSGLDALLDLYDQLIPNSSRAIDAAHSAPPTNESGGSSLGAGCDLYAKGDYKAALPLLEAAADAGESEANFLLGIMYQVGTGVAVDYEQSKRRYEAAAKKEHGNAALNLGILYQAGLLGEDSLRQALYWYERAEALGAKPAIEKRLEVLDVLDPELAGLTRVALARAKPRGLWDRMIARR